MTNKLLILGCVVFAGCVETSTSKDVGNPALGIVEFKVEETDTKTSVSGLNEQGLEVARMDLVHGEFALTGPFVSDYDTAVVVGRKLDVNIQGQQLVWETAGFDPTLQMPAHPADQVYVAAFLADAHVSSILQRWEIGFRPSLASTGEVAFANISGSYDGWDAADCGGSSTCGSAHGMTINMCSTPSPIPTSAWRATQVNPVGGDQYKIAMCCPASEMTPRWFSIKTCALDTPDFGQPSVSECGSSFSACKGCPTYPHEYKNNSCEVTFDGVDTVNYQYRI